MPQRARTQLDEARERFPLLTPEATVVVTSQGGGVAWWTFAGRNANVAIAPAVAILVPVPRIAAGTRFANIRTDVLDEIRQFTPVAMKNYN